MKQWTTVDRTTTPNGKTITLDEHDGDYTIRVDGATLMMTRMHFSEEKAAELACEHLKGKKGARVLIGGLGFGFTLRATLAAVGRDARVTVAEILEAVIAWNRNPDLPLAADVLGDPRTVVAQRDVYEIIGAARREFDAIILDVDNGPAAVTTDDNRRLYTGAGLRSVYGALRAGGCVAFWSAGPDEPFERAMRSAGFQVDVKTVRARPTGGRRHTIFLGRVN